MYLSNNAEGSALYTKLEIGAIFRHVNFVCIVLARHKQFLQPKLLCAKAIFGPANQHDMTDLFPDVYNISIPVQCPDLINVGFIL